MPRAKKALLPPSREAPLVYITKAQYASRQLKDPFGAMYSLNGAIEPIYPPDRLVLLAEENAIHAACIHAKAVDAVGRGWRLEAVSNAALSDVEERMRDELDALCPEFSFAEILQSASEEELKIGWSAWEVVRDERGEIGALYPVPAQTIRVMRDEQRWTQIIGGVTRYFVAFGKDLSLDPASGEAANLPADKRASELLVFRSYSSATPWYGVPNWVACIPAIAELTAIREFNISFFSSGGLADRIIHITAADPAQAKELSAAVARALEESQGAAHVTIHSHGTPDTTVDAKSLQPTTGKREGSFMTRRADLIKEVLTAHHVPPYRIGMAELGSLGGSAAKEMMRAYRVGAVEPLQTILENRLRRTLFGPKGLDITGYRWVLEDVDFDETELDLAIATTAVSGGLFTPNDGRKQLGAEPYRHPAMDRIYLGGVLLTPALTNTPAPDGLTPGGLDVGTDELQPGSRPPDQQPERGHGQADGGSGTAGLALPAASTVG